MNIEKMGDVSWWMVNGVGWGGEVKGACVVLTRERMDGSEGRDGE
jgi:hypothetical protein